MQTVAPPPVALRPVPDDKEELALYLKEAAALEQQFMCQYLYAAFSLKKQPDETCSPAQLEIVRRWASQIYMIARQEMEHLSIANSLLTAIGSQPWFGHSNFPTQAPWYESSALEFKKLLQSDPDPCDFPFFLQAFELSVAKRFCCMESPLIKYVSPQDQENVLKWCYKTSDDSCGCTPASNDLLKSNDSLMPWRGFVPKPDPAANDVQPGTVQELYEAIAEGFKRLNSTLGPKVLFSGHQSGQSQIPSEYDIYLFSICDLDTALTGIRLITQQGEGIDGPPGYDSHFQNYYDMVVEYEALLKLDPKFKPSLPLPFNPKLKQYKTPITAKAVEAFNAGYVAMLYMLAAYYANYRSSKYNQMPYLFQALEQTVFAPTMTMLIRSLAEVITQLPADKKGAPAGPTFYLSDLVLKMLENPTAPVFLDINFHIGNLKEVAGMLEKIIAQEEPVSPRRPKWIYIHQNVLRMMANLEYIYENGTYPKFVNLPTCSEDESCS